MIYEVVLEQQWLGQTLINRWNYQSSSTPASVSRSFALVSAMGMIIPQPSNLTPAGSLMQALREMQHGALRYVQATCRAIYDPVDFYATPFVPNLFGAVNSNANSPVMAFGFRTNRVRQDISRGTKRFGGVTDLAQGDGGNVNPAFVTAGALLASRMQEDLTYVDEGTNITFQPIVVSKQEYSTPRGNRAYRYYPTLAEQEAKVGTSILWEFIPTLRSQVSRQYGRGV